MPRTSRFSSFTAMVVMLGLTSLAGCGLGEEMSVEGESYAQREAALNACHLNDGTVEMDADLRACDPGDKKKTTICHVPPGNPANAHTLCIGNAAVKHHLANHDDYLGPCKRETMCPLPPPPSGAGGSGGGTGGSYSGAGGAAGAGGVAGGSGAGGAAGAMVPGFVVD